MAPKGPERKSVFEKIASTQQDIVELFSASHKKRTELMRAISAQWYPHLNIPSTELENIVNAQAVTAEVLNKLKDKEYLTKWRDSLKIKGTQILIDMGYKKERVINMLKDEQLKATLSRLWQKLSDQKTAKQNTETTLRAIKNIRGIINVQGLIDMPLKESASFFMDLVAKESSFNQGSVSQTGAVGMYQLTNDACKGVDQNFDTEIDKKDVYYTGTDQEKLKESTTNNAKVGILYWHICKYQYAKNMTTERDQNLAASFMYNAGVGTFNSLWKSLRVKNYNDFEQKLSDYLIKNVEQIKQNKSEKLEKKIYNVKFRSLLKIDDAQKKQKEIKIGGRTYEIWKLLDGLHYVRIIDEIRKGKYVKTIQKPS